MVAGGVWDITQNVVVDVTAAAYWVPVMTASDSDKY